MIDINDSYLTLLDDGGETREDLKLPEGELGQDIEKRHGNGDSFLVSWYHYKLRQFPWPFSA